MEIYQNGLSQGLRSLKVSFALSLRATAANSSSWRPTLNFSERPLSSKRQGSQSVPHSGYFMVSFRSTRCSTNSASSSLYVQFFSLTFSRQSSMLTLASSLKPDPLTTSLVLFSASSSWMTARSCISSRCSRRTSLSSGVTPLRNLAGLPAQISPSFTSLPSATTAPAATTPPEWTVACLTVAPMETKELLCRLEPWRVTLGPTKTLSPICAPLETCTLSWSTELLPTLMGEVPRRVDPYQTEEFSPTDTSPKMAALGAMKLDSSRWGTLPPWASRLRLGVTLSSLSVSPSSEFPAAQSCFPVFLRKGPTTFSLMLFISSQITTLINININKHIQLTGSILSLIK